EGRGTPRGRRRGPLAVALRRLASCRTLGRVGRRGRLAALGPRAPRRGGNRLGRALASVFARALLRSRHVVTSGRRRSKVLARAARLWRFPALAGAARVRRSHRYPNAEVPMEPVAREQPYAASAHEWTRSITVM